MVRWRQSVPKLDSAEVFQDLIVEKGQPVSYAEVILVKRETFLRSDRFPRDREVGSADFLPAKEVADGINRLKLEIEIWFKMKFHRQLEKKILSIMRDWEDPNNHPGIRGDLIELLGRPQKNRTRCLIASVKGVLRRRGGGRVDLLVLQDRPGRFSFRAH